MKKLLFFAAAASVALVACTKNEVAQIDNEITYQTVQTRAEALPFSTSNKFKSYAYFLPQGKTWNNNFNDPAKLYISAALISFDSNKWKAENTYYWPKQGSLTFFAWSTNTAAPAITEGIVDCSQAKGIIVDSYDLTKNKNVDFLVAEVAKDQEENTKVVGSWLAGVPTDFKHALSSIAFKVQKVQNYSNVTFTVKSIELQGVSTKASYAQTWNAAAPSSHKWTNTTPVTTGNIPAFTGEYVVNTVFPAEVEALGISGTDYYIVLPQTIDSAMKFKIVYDITTNFTGTPVIETVTEIIDLDDIYTTGWEPGKKYTVTLKLSMNEILWAPTVEEWVLTATEFPI